MREIEFRSLCNQRGLKDAEITAAVDTIRGFEALCASHGQTLESATQDILKEYLRQLVAAGENSKLRLAALASYAYNLSGNYSLYAYIQGVAGGTTVFPSIAARTAEIAGTEVRDAVFAGITPPQLGSLPGSYPAVTQAMIERLSSSLPIETCQHILAGNHHRMPTDGFGEHLRAYREGGVDGLLRFRHESLLAVLEEHAKSGKPWYEQMITPEVVDFVRRNQEIQSGVRCGSAIYVTKIPYAPVEYLRESDPRMKRYYQCHCPLARASIIDESPRVSPLLCHCSGGYEKLVFDVVFDESTRVSVLQSALAGDLTCRFRVEIPEGR